MEEYPRAYLYQRIVRAKLYIDAHFAEDIQVPCIASQSFFSTFHFIRQFKAIYGSTPHQYLISLRVSKAKELLAEERSITDVCFEVGFTSLGSFTTLFRKMVGITPSEYREREFRESLRIRLQPASAIPDCFVQANGWRT